MIEIELKDLKYLLAALEEANASGYNWVAFDNRVYDTVNHQRLHYFISPTKAEDFCSDRNYNGNVLDYSEYAPNYRYMAINSMLQQLQPSIEEKQVQIITPEDALRDGSYHLIYQNSISIKNSIIMNQENFNYLKDQVKFTGFGESLENDLRTNIEKKQPTFQLTYPHEFGKDETVATLNFRRSDQNDMYFFNNYHLSVKQSGEKEPLTQTFYVGKDNTFTLKEGYNLLSGRAVNKDLVNKEHEGYNAWVQLNFKETDTSGNYKLKHYTENYGYDIGDALSKHPIKELANSDDKAKLLESLQKGNRQSVTFLNGSVEQKRFIEANPQYKSITVYDGSMKRIRQDQKEGETNGQSASQGKKNTQKQKDDDGDTGKSNNNKKRKSQHVS